MTLLDAALIFTQTNVQLPMQVVLNPPMTTQHLGILADSHFPATHKVAYFRGRFVFDGPLAATHAHGLQLGPGLTIADALYMMDDHIRAVFLAAMPLLHGAMLQHHLRGKFSVQGTL